MGLIYRITNLINGKSYIGQTSRSLEERWEEHLKSSVSRNFRLYRAIRKYGPDNFKVERLALVSLDEMDSLEIKFIGEFKTLTPDGYNMTVGGGGTRGHKFTKGPLTEDHKRKVSEAKKGKPMSEEHKIKMSLALKGKPKSEESIKKMAESKRGKAIKRLKKGLPLREEHKRKLSLSQKLRWERQKIPNSL